MMTDASGTDSLLMRAGDFMVGLADTLKIIVEMLYQFGTALIERANIMASEQRRATS